MNRNHPNRDQTLSLLRAIGYPTSDGFLHSSKHSENLFELAKQNKIGNLYLWRLEKEELLENVNQDIQVEPSEQFEELQQTVKRISELFSNEDLEFALVKTPIDFPADFSDVDVLVKENEIERAREALKTNNYEELANSPSSTDLKDPKTNVTVDIQDNFTLRELVYLSGEEVLKRSDYQTKFGEKVRIPNTPTQISLIVIHSLTEQLFTLRDFYHILNMFETLTWSGYRELRQLISKFGLQGAMNAMLPLVSKVSLRAFEKSPEALRTAVEECQNYREFSNLQKKNWQTPHRYAASTMLRVVAHKFRDPIFRSSTIDELKELRDPQTVKSNVKQLVYRQRRETY